MQKISSQRLTIPAAELDLRHTLTPGQSFRWKEDVEGRWTGVIGDAVVRVRREGDDICWESFPGDLSAEVIRDYFRVEVDLPALYEDLRRADPLIHQALLRFQGLRVLRQDPEETLLSYICSAANSVTRISESVEILSREFGDFLAQVDGREYYSFPTARALAAADAGHMSGMCSLGFRCANLISVAGQILSHPPGWLMSLRCAGLEDARREMLTVKGVGLKIADCVLLFALDKDNAFPVDTHIRQVAVGRYLPEFGQKTLTPVVYERIAEYFRRLYGTYAGWAQEYLFYDDLLRRTRPE